MGHGEGLAVASCPVVNTAPCAYMFALAALLRGHSIEVPPELEESVRACSGAQPRVSGKLLRAYRLALLSRFCSRCVLFLTCPWAAAFREAEKAC